MTEPKSRHLVVSLPPDMIDSGGLPPNSYHNPLLKVDLRCQVDCVCAQIRVVATMMETPRSGANLGYGKKRGGRSSIVSGGCYKCYHSDMQNANTQAEFFSDCTNDLIILSFIKDLEKMT